MKITAALEKYIQDAGSNFETEEYSVEKILNKRVTKGKVEYYLKWKGYNENENSWEPVENLNCKKLIKQFEEKLKKEAKEKEKRQKEFRDQEKIVSECGGISISPNPTVLNTASGAGQSTKSKKTNLLKKQCSKLADKDFSDNIICDDRQVSDLFSKSREPESIICAAVIDGQLWFLMKWKDNNEETDVISSNEANILYPQVVIRYYEERIRWH